MINETDDRPVYVVGDIHGDFKWFNNFLQETNPKIVFACGDFGYWPYEHLHKKLQADKTNTIVYFCDGNHEHHDALKILKQTKNFEITKNVFYMPRGSVLKYNNYNILFMGGAISIDKNWRTPGFDWFPDEVIKESDMLELPECSIDIVISHTSPTEFQMKETFKDIDMKDPSSFYLSIILQKYKPKYWYFGHWHYFKTDTYIGNNWACEWTCLDMSRKTNFARQILYLK